MYCYPVQWGDGYDRVYVLGKPRNRFGLIRLIMPRKYIENFRLQKLYNRQVIERMHTTPKKGAYVIGWDDSDADRMQIKEMLAWLSLTEDEERRLFKVIGLESLILESEIEGCADGRAVL